MRIEVAASKVAFSGKSAVIKAAKIVNGGDSPSGTLRLRLVASKTRYSGGTLYGYVVATRKLGKLSAGYMYTGIKGKVRYYKPKPGRYYMTLVLEEYTSDGYVIVDHVKFSKKDELINGGSSLSATIRLRFLRLK